MRGSVAKKIRKSCFGPRMGKETGLEQKMRGSMLTVMPPYPSGKPNLQRLYLSDCPRSVFQTVKKLWTRTPHNARNALWLKLHQVES